MRNIEHTQISNICLSRKQRQREQRRKKPTIFLLSYHVSILKPKTHNQIKNSLSGLKGSTIFNKHNDFKNQFFDLVQSVKEIKKYFCELKKKFSLKKLIRCQAVIIVVIITTTMINHPQRLLDLQTKIHIFKTVLIPHIPEFKFNWVFDIFV